MISILFVAIVCICTVAGSALNQGVLLKERQIPRDSFIQLPRTDIIASAPHECVIAINKLNLDRLESSVISRSTPGHPLYQKWMTYDEVGGIIQNNEGHARVVKWLQDNHVQITWTSRRKDYIKAVAPISHWEKLLSTTFYEFEDRTMPIKEKNGDDAAPKFKRMFRAESYSIPSLLEDDIHAIFNTVQTPPPYKQKYYVRPSPKYGAPYKTTLRIGSQSQDQSATPGVVTVAFLNSYYSIPTNLGSSNVQQSVFETSDEYFSAADLKQFQTTYGLTVQSANSIGNHMLPGPCPTSSSSVDCYEGNLDVQYIMGVSQQTVSIYWWVSDASNSTVDPFLTWITDLADTPNPPKSNSMSWGTIEQTVSPAIMSAFNNEAMQLAALGVTIMVSSGDDGAPNSYGRCLCNDDSGSTRSSWAGNSSWVGRGYFPSFPATSPYVTACGATMGPEDGKPEVVCQGNTGGVITSAGGFSTYYPTPSWQLNTIKSYFKTQTTKPTPGFNPYGRGIPDLSLIGVDYQVVVSGQIVSLFGTSCTAPVLAAYTSLVNAQRMNAGKGSVGFLNPTLYAVGYNNTIGAGNAYNAQFNDITSGNNKCCAQTATANCCKSGFTAQKGWDPTTGWGSIDYTDFSQIFS